MDSCIFELGVYRGAKTYKALFEAIMDFWSSRRAFQAAANALSNSRYNASESSQGMYEPRCQIGSRRVMMRSNTPLSPLDTKADA